MLLRTPTSLETIDPKLGNFRAGFGRWPVSVWIVPFVCFHGANNGQLIHVLRYAWEDLRDLDARGIRRNRSESAVSLDVPAVEVADPSLEPYQNNRLSLGLRSRSQRSRQSLNA